MEERYYTRPELIQIAKKAREERKTSKEVPLWLGVLRVLLFIGFPTAIAFVGVMLINGWMPPIGIKILGGVTTIEEAERILGKL